MMADEKQFDAVITRTLEQKPAVTVPVDFAAKVRAALPPERKARSGHFAGRSVSRIAGTVAVVGLLVAMCLLAPHARPSFESVAFDFELLVLVELAGVAAWMGRAGIRG